MSIPAGQASLTIFRQPDFQPLFKHSFPGKNSILNEVSLEFMKPESSFDGQWKNSRFLQDSQMEGQLKKPKLAHVTSFEQKCMEDHGKNLVQSYLSFVREISKSVSLFEEVGSGEQKRIKNEEDLQAYIIEEKQIPDEDKKVLLNFSEKSIEARQLLVALCHFTPGQFLAGVFKLAAEIFCQYDILNINMLDEKEWLPVLEREIEQNQELLEMKFLPHGLSIELSHSQKEVRTLLEIWMKQITFSLQGILQNPLRRRLTEDEMSEDYQVAKSRKMIKLNNSGSFEQRK